MHREEILLISNNNNVILRLNNLLNDDFRLTTCPHQDAVRTFEKNPYITGIIYDLSGEDESSLKDFLILRTRFDDVRILILTGNRLCSIDKGQDPHHLFWCLDRLDEKALRDRVLDFKKTRVNTIEKMRLVEIAFASSPIGIAIMPNNDISHSFINQAFEEILGYTREEYIKIGWNNLTYPEDRKIDEQARQVVEEVGENHFNIEKRIIRKDGKIVWISQFTAIIDKKKDDTYVRLVMIRSIDTRKNFEEKLRESDRSRSTLLQNLPGLAYRCANDDNWTMEFVSDGALELTGYEPAQFINNRIVSYNEIIVRKYRNLIREEWEKVIRKKGVFQFEYEIITKNAMTKWVYERGVPIYDQNGKVLALEGIIIDLTRTKKLEKQLQYFNDFNHKLKLPNRELLIKKIQTKLDNNSTTGTLFLVNFKDTQRLYRTHGYQYVELLTASLVSKLKTLETPGLALYYAEEDIYIYYSRHKMKSDEIKDFFNQISEVVSKTVTREQIQCNIGVSFLSKSITYAENALLKARVASEYMREDGTPINMHIYDDDLEREVKRQEELKRELIDLSYDEGYGNLRLVFQPIMNLKTGKIASFEALARYHSPSYGPVAPLEFIPIVEKNRIIVAFGKKIINLALSFIKKLVDLGINNYPVAINISALQLLDADFCSDLVHRINRYGVPFNLVLIEVTESVFSSDYTQLNNALSQLKQYGIGVAIDDFGTGFSSLSRIEKLHIDTVKIDRIFIERLTRASIHTTTLPEIIKICRKFKLNSLAEGIETKDQYDLLQDFGCDFGQGYYMSRPLEVSDALDFAKKDYKK